MRRITQAAIVAAALVIPAAIAPAVAASPSHSFVANGDTYDYTADRAKDGAVLVRGTIENTGQAFDLRVRHGRVEGNVGANPVTFTVSSETMARLENEMADSTGGSPTAVAAN